MRIEDYKFSIKIKHYKIKLYQMVEETKTVTTEEETVANDEDVVTPFEITATTDAGIDYDKLIEKYGCYPITPELIARLERAIGEKAHRFIRRGIFFC